MRSLSGEIDEEGSELTAAEQAAFQRIGTLGDFKRSIRTFENSCSLLMELYNVEGGDDDDPGMTLSTGLLASKRDVETLKDQELVLQFVGPSTDTLHDFLFQYSQTLPAARCIRMLLSTAGAKRERNKDPLGPDFIFKSCEVVCKLVSDSVSRPLEDPSLWFVPPEFRRAIGLAEVDESSSSDGADEPLTQPAMERGRNGTNPLLTPTRIGRIGGSRSLTPPGQEDGATRPTRRVKLEPETEGSPLSSTQEVQTSWFDTPVKDRSQSSPEVSIGSSSRDTVEPVANAEGLLQARINASSSQPISVEREKPEQGSLGQQTTGVVLPSATQEPLRSQYSSVGGQFSQASQMGSQRRRTLTRLADTKFRKWHCMVVVVHAAAEIRQTQGGTGAYSRQLSLVDEGGWLKTLFFADAVDHLLPDVTLGTVLLLDGVHVKHWAGSGEDGKQGNCNFGEWQCLSLVPRVSGRLEARALKLSGSMQPQVTSAELERMQELSDWYLHRSGARETLLRHPKATLRTLKPISEINQPGQFFDMLAQVVIFFAHEGSSSSQAMNKPVDLFITDYTWNNLNRASHDKHLGYAEAEYAQRMAKGPGGGWVFRLALWEKQHLAVHGLTPGQYVHIQNVNSKRTPEYGIHGSVGSRHDLNLKVRDASGHPNLPELLERQASWERQRQKEIHQRAMQEEDNEEAWQEAHGQESDRVEGVGTVAAVPETDSNANVTEAQAELTGNTVDQPGSHISGHSDASQVSLQSRPIPAQTVNLGSSQDELVSDSEGEAVVAAAEAAKAVESAQVQVLAHAQGAAAEVENAEEESVAQNGHTIRSVSLEAQESEVPDSAPEVEVEARAKIFTEATSPVAAEQPMMGSLEDQTEDSLEPQQLLATAAMELELDDAVKSSDLVTVAELKHIDSVPVISSTPISGRITRRVRATVVDVMPHKSTGWLRPRPSKGTTSAGSKIFLALLLRQDGEDTLNPEACLPLIVSDSDALEFFGITQEEVDAYLPEEGSGLPDRLRTRLEDVIGWQVPTGNDRENEARSSSDPQVRDAKVYEWGVSVWQNKKGKKLFGISGTRIVDVT